MNYHVHFKKRNISPSALALAKYIHISTRNPGLKFCNVSIFIKSLPSLDRLAWWLSFLEKICRRETSDRQTHTFQ